MDERFLYEVEFRRKAKISDAFLKTSKEVWTASTLASRLTNPFFLIVEAHGKTYTDANTIRSAILIEAKSIE